MLEKLLPWPDPGFEDEHDDILLFENIYLISF